MINIKIENVLKDAIIYYNDLSKTNTSYHVSSFKNPLQVCIIGTYPKLVVTYLPIISSLIHFKVLAEQSTYWYHIDILLDS